MRDATLRTRSIVVAVLLGACGSEAAVGPDASSFDAPPAPVDAGSDAPLDAPASGSLLVSWRFYREGVPDPTVTCADLDAQTAMIMGGVGLPGTTVPCDQHFILLERVPPQELDPLLFIVRPNPDGMTSSSRVGLRPAAPVTVVAGATTYVPLELRLFDEPYPQLQQLFDGAAAFYAASPAPKVFPSGEPGYAGCGCATPGGICAPDATRWTVPPFSQLGFHVSGLSRFTYDFHAQGSGAAATFTITAYADYDCDAAIRQYTIHGSVASDGTVVGAETIVVDDND